MHRLAEDSGDGKGETRASASEPTSTHTEPPSGVRPLTAARAQGPAGRRSYGQTFPVLSVSIGAPVRGSSPSDAGNGLPGAPPGPLTVRVMASPSTEYLPVRCTMPDHTQTTWGGHGDTRSVALNVPPAAKSMCLGYVLSPHEAEAHVPTTDTAGLASVPVGSVAVPVAGAVVVDP